MDIPARSATDRYLAGSHIQLSYSFGVDLGELIPGHHVIARGIGLAQSVPPSLAESSSLPSGVVENVKQSNQTPRDQVHFEHVPGLSRGHVTPDWGFEARDDVGTAYNKDDQGAYDGHSGGIATHAVRELGGKIPPNASRLNLRIIPGYDGTGHQWRPPEPWRRELVIELRTGNPID
jgi:hypothetical protein